MVSKITFIDPNTGKQRTIERKSGSSARQQVAKATGRSGTTVTRRTVRKKGKEVVGIESQKITYDIEGRAIGASPTTVLTKDKQEPVKQTQEQITKPVDINVGGQSRQKGFVELGTTSQQPQFTELAKDARPAGIVRDVERFLETDLSKESVRQLSSDIVGRTLKSQLRLTSGGKDVITGRKTTTEGFIDTAKTGAIAGGSLIAGGLPGAIAVTASPAIVKGVEKLTTSTLSTEQQDFLKSEIGQEALRRGAAARDIEVSEFGSFQRLGQAIKGQAISDTQSKQKTFTELATEPSKAAQIGKESLGLVSEFASSLTTAGGGKRAQDAFLIGAQQFITSQGIEYTPEIAEALIRARAGRAGGEIAAIGVAGATAEGIGSRGISAAFKSASIKTGAKDIGTFAASKAFKPLVKAGAIEGAAVTQAEFAARGLEASAIDIAKGAAIGGAVAGTVGVGLIKGQTAFTKTGRRLGKAYEIGINIADPTEIATDFIFGVAQKGAKKAGRKFTRSPVITSTGKSFTLTAEGKAPTKTKTVTKIQAKTQPTTKTKVEVLQRQDSFTESKSGSRSDSKPFVDVSTDTSPFVDAFTKTTVGTKTQTSPFVQTQAQTQTSPFVQTQTRTQAQTKTAVKVGTFTPDVPLIPFIPGGGQGRRGRRSRRGIGVVGKAPSLVRVVRGGKELEKFKVRRF